jgi:hypothetical protein
MQAAALHSARQHCRLANPALVVPSIPQMQGADAAAVALSARMDGAEAAISTVRATVDQQPTLWEGAVEGAVVPLRQQLADAVQRLATMQQDLSVVDAQASRAAAAMAELDHHVAFKLSSEWQADVAGAVQPLHRELASVQQRQGDVEKTLEVGPLSF